MEELAVDHFQAMLKKLQEGMDLHTNLIHLSVLLSVIEHESRGKVAEIRNITQALNLDRRVVSRAINSLSDVGSDHRNGMDLLYSTPSSDRRTRQIHLQEKAKSLAGEMLECLDEFVSVSVQGLGIVFCDNDGCVEWANTRYEDMCGYSVDELLGRRPGEVLKGAKSELAVTQRIRNAIERRESVHDRLTKYNKDGRPYLVDINVDMVSEGRESARLVALERFIKYI